MSFKVHLGHKLNNKCAQTMFRLWPSCRVIKQLKVQLMKVKVRAKAKRSSKLPHGSCDPSPQVSLADRNIMICFTFGLILLKISTLFHFSDLNVMLCLSCIQSHFLADFVLFISFLFSLPHISLPLYERSDSFTTSLSQEQEQEQE